eukprot:m.286357 g.286357  ORF g.286357 m.286357 type:complete len:169 (-) comp54986_c0_seq11:63-569(-)
MGDLIIEWNALSPNGRPYLDFLGVFVHALVRPFVCVVVPDLSCSCWCFLVAFSLFLCVPLVSMCVVLQIVWPTEKGEDDEPNMVEIGPRFVLNPIRVFEGCFGGPTLYANEEYISPNLLRRRARQEAQNSAKATALTRRDAEVRRRINKPTPDEVEEVFRDSEKLYSK